MSSNLHKNAHYSDDNMHEVKGFPSAPNNSAYQKNIQGLSEWQRKKDHGNVISLINGYEAPPTEVDGDVYAILTPSLDVDAITWQSATTVRFTFSAGYTNIYAVNNYLQVSGETNIKHDGVFLITAIDASYLEITNELIIDATDDVASASTASAYVSHQDFDPENLSNGNSIPRNGVVRYFSGVDLWYGDSFETGDSYFNTTTTTFSAYDGSSITSTIDGIYAGSGTAPTTTIVTLTDTLNFNDGEVIIKGAGATSGTFNFLAQNSSGQTVIKGRDDRWVGIKTDTQLGSETLTVGGTLVTTGAVGFGSATPTGATISTPVGWTLNLGVNTQLKDHVSNNSTWLRVRGSTLQVTQDNLVSYFEVTNPTDKSSISHLIARTLTSGAQVGDAEYRMTSSYWDGAAGQIKTGSMILTSANTTGDTQLDFSIEGTDIASFHDDGNVSIGNPTIAARLHIKGAGATSATTSLLVEDSAGVDNFFVRDDGMVSSTNGYSINGILFMHATYDGTQNMDAFNTFVGRSTGIGATGASERNVGIGYQSLLNITIGEGNTAIGAPSLSSLTTGFNNVGMGLNALLGLTTGAGNVGIGVSALDAITTSNSNVGIGVNAFGSLAGASTFNVGIGADAYLTNTLGSQNTGIGYKAGNNITSGNDNTMIGAWTGAVTSGAYSASIALGRSAWITASNQMVVGNSLSSLHINDVYWGAGVSGTSITPTTFKMQVTSITDGQTDTAPSYDFILAGSQGTGTGIGSDIIFKTAPAGTTGTTQNALVTAMTIQGDGNVGIGIASPTEVVEILGNVKVTGQVYSDIPTTLIPTGTTQIIDFNNGNGQILDLGSATGDVTLTLNNPKAGATYFLKIIQDATTPRDLIYPASVKWSESTTPVVSTGALAVDSIVLFWDGATFLAHLTPNYG